ncbi:hypothetical protein Bca52824_025897 [Brassica carinata]|uniref:Uncharacterized protein n=1 Tax=Brassica carinata TaxID=52824 RepID=A0A8X7V8B5_BRACI|nr:hypothetical protein Bca52824_025897 [Brassica carinata]
MLKTRLNHSCVSPLRAQGLNSQVEKTRDQVMTELQDVTKQYLCCSDPVEQAARRQRVLEGDAQGQLEEIADSIMANSYTPRQPGSTERLEIRSEDSPPISLPVERQLNQTHRPLETEEKAEEALISNQSNARRKKRRNEAKLKSIVVTPNILNGTSSRKRNISQIRTSPRRSSKSPVSKRLKDNLEEQRELKGF